MHSFQSETGVSEVYEQAPGYKRRKEGRRGGYRNKVAILTHQSINPSIHQSIPPSIHPSITQSVHSFIHTFIKISFLPENTRKPPMIIVSLIHRVKNDQICALMREVKTKDEMMLRPSSLSIHSLAKYRWFKNAQIVLSSREDGSEPARDRL